MTGGLPSPGRDQYRPLAHWRGDAMLTMHLGYASDDVALREQKSRMFNFKTTSGGPLIDTRKLCKPQLKRLRATKAMHPQYHRNTKKN